MEGFLRLVNVAATCLFLSFLATNGASIPTKFLWNKNGSIVHPESVYLVGMADGKGFFADNDVYLNWTSAKAYCENANMQLASITSQAQATMLNNSFNSDMFRGTYWTAGRDILALQQFAWDTVDIQLDSNYLNFTKNSGHLTCVFYYSQESNSDVRNAGCDSEIRPLCDTGNHSN